MNAVQPGKKRPAGLARFKRHCLRPSREDEMAQPGVEITTPTHSHCGFPEPRASMPAHYAGRLRAHAITFAGARSCFNSLAMNFM